MALLCAGLEPRAGEAGGCQGRPELALLNWARRGSRAQRGDLCVEGGLAVGTPRLGSEVGMVAAAMGVSCREV